MYCPICTKKELKTCRVSYKMKLFCKLCGVDLEGAKFAKCCVNPSCSGYTACVNCSPCPGGHNMYRCFKITQQRRTNQGSLYDKDQYCCDQCGITKTFAPYTYHCMACETDYCPEHLFHVEDEILEAKIVRKLDKPLSLMDPFKSRVVNIRQQSSYPQSQGDLTGILLAQKIISQTMFPMDQQPLSEILPHPPKPPFPLFDVTYI